MHRRAQIIDAFNKLFEPLKDKSECPYDREEFPLVVQTVQKRYRHWTTLDQQGALPAILLNYDEVLRNREGGENAEFASLGETEEYVPIAIDVVLKEVSLAKPPYAEHSETLKAFMKRSLTDQVSDAIYTVERLINGTPDLDVEGVCRTRVREVHTSAGRISALEGTPFEIVRHKIVVTHVYPSNSSV